jgi:hypothetical protein
MSPHPRFNARLILIALGLVTQTALATALRAAWLLGGAAARLGRSLSWMLSRYLERPIQIKGVRTDGHSYIELREVRVPSTGQWSSDLLAREVRVEGAFLPLALFPRGRHLSVRVVSTTVSVAPGTEALAPPTEAALERVRKKVRTLLTWPATAAFSLTGGEIRSGGQTIRFDLTGEKSADGQAAFTLTAYRSPEARLIVKGVGAASGETLGLRFSAEGDPQALGSLWPVTLSPGAQLRALLNVRLPGPELLDLAGEATLTPVSGPRPATLALSASYYPASAHADISQLILTWGEAVALEASGRAEALNGSPRLALRGRGRVEETPVQASLLVNTAERKLQTVARVSGADLRRWLHRLGDTRRLPRNLEVRADTAQVAADLAWSAEGEVEWSRIRGQLDRVEVSRGGARVSAPTVRLITTVAPGGGDEMIAEGWLFAQALDARAFGVKEPMAVKANARLRLDRKRPWSGIGLFEGGGGSLSTPAGETIVEGTLRSGGNVELLAPDLGRLPQLVPNLTYALSGNARVVGRLAWSPEGAPQFLGEARLQMPRASVRELGAEIGDVRVSLPISHGTETRPSPGAVTMESLNIHGVGFRRFRAVAQLRNGLLDLPDATYVHYGGTGRGWVQAELANPDLPIRFRFEGERLDLTRFFEEYGLKAARVSGTARYVVGLIHTRQNGAEAAGRLWVDEPGGVVSIDVLRSLLSHAPEGPMGLVRDTLEGLSEFPYKSLSGEISMAQGETRIDLSLQGRERFGIFPPKIRAINIQNLPLSFVVKVLGSQRRDR